MADIPFWQRIQGHFRTLFGGSVPAASDSKGDDTEKSHHIAPFLSTLQVLHDLDKARQALQESNSPDSLDNQRQAALEDEKNQILQLQTQMLSDILDLHQRLETGLHQEALTGLSQRLKDHCSEFKGYHDDHLSHMAMYAVMQRFHQESLLYGWQCLNGDLCKRNIAWPEPTGLGPSTDEEERRHARQLQYRTIQESFLAGPLIRYADLMLGIVPVWRAVYPQRGGSAWNNTVYQAVGGALACQRHEQILKLAEQHHDHLEQLVAQQLTGRLEEIQTRLAAGVQSIAAAWSLTDEAVRLCQKTAPDAVWSFLSPQLDRQ